MQKSLTVTEMFDLTHTIAAPLLEKCTYPWEALKDIGVFIRETGAALPADEYACPQPDVWIHRTATVFASAYIAPPCIIGPGAEVRHCAFIRGNALIGAGCVVGNSTELKNVILFDDVQVPHYNYVGDSILGYKAHMGAGAITSNVKSDKQHVVIHGREGDIATGIKKVGAMLGDHAEIGCGSVLNPGTVIGKNASVYPLSSVRGEVPEGHIFKDKDHIIPRK